MRFNRNISLLLQRMEARRRVEVTGVLVSNVELSGDAQRAGGWRVEFTDVLAGGTELAQQRGAEWRCIEGGVGDTSGNGREDGWAWQQWHRGWVKRSDDRTP